MDGGGGAARQIGGAYGNDVAVLVGDGLLRSRQGGGDGAGGVGGIGIVRIQGVGPFGGGARQFAGFFQIGGGSGGGSGEAVVVRFQEEGNFVGTAFPDNLVMIVEVAFGGVRFRHGNPGIVFAGFNEIFLTTPASAAGTGQNRPLRPLPAGRCTTFSSCRPPTR